MAKIHFGKVVIGGIIAGIVINASDVLLNTLVWGEVNRQILAAQGTPDPAVVAGIALWRLLRGFILGFVAVYVYAGIKPRFGASSHAAVTAGIVVWMLHYALGAVSRMVVGEYPINSLLLVVFLGSLAAAVSGTLLGAKFYREPAA